MVYDNYTDNFFDLFNSGRHGDVTFYVGSEKEGIVAHKSILSARSEYFFTMFRPGGLGESNQREIDMINQDVGAFRRALEFIYTNKIRDLHDSDANSIANLIMVANEYILIDLKKLCSSAAEKVLTVENIGKFMLLSASHCVPELRDACIRFVRSEKAALRQNREFLGDLESYPEIALVLFDAMQDGDTELDNQDIINTPNFKRARISDSQAHEIPSQSTSSNMIQSGSNNGDVA